MHDGAPHAPCLDRAIRDRRMCSQHEIVPVELIDTIAGLKCVRLSPSWPDACASVTVAASVYPDSSKGSWWTVELCRLAASLV